MDKREFQAQIKVCIDQALDELQRSPDALKSLFAAEFFGTMSDARSPALDAARQRFTTRKKALGTDKLAHELRTAGGLELLISLWQGLGQAHYSGAELHHFAVWLIALAADAETLAQLPFGVVNWCGGWGQVGSEAVAACEELAAAALAKDPENEAALYLYAQPDFLERVNSGRSKAKKLTGPPVPNKSAAQKVTKIRAIIARYEADEHPTQIPSMDSIAVDSAEVIAALIAGLSSDAWRARVRCVEALGRTKRDHDRVVGALCAVIDQPHLTDEVAMAVHYHLKGKGTAALDTLIQTTEQKLQSLKQQDTMDYGHRWPLSALLSLAPYCRGEARKRAHEFLRGLFDSIDKLPKWKQERLQEFQYEAPPILAKLGRA